VKIHLVGVHLKILLKKYPKEVGGRSLQWTFESLQDTSNHQRWDFLFKSIGSVC